MLRQGQEQHDCDSCSNCNDLQDEAQHQTHLCVVYFAKFFPHGQSICHDLQSEFAGISVASHELDCIEAFSGITHLTWMVVVCQAVDNR